MKITGFLSRRLYTRRVLILFDSFHQNDKHVQEVLEEENKLHSTLPHSDLHGDQKKKIEAKLKTINHIQRNLRTMKNKWQSDKADEIQLRI